MIKTLFICLVYMTLLTQHQLIYAQGNNLNADSIIALAETFDLNHSNRAVEVTSKSPSVSSRQLTVQIEEGGTLVERGKTSLTYPINVSYITYENAKGDILAYFESLNTTVLALSYIEKKELLNRLNASKASDLKALKELTANIDVQFYEQEGSYNLVFHFSPDKLREKGLLPPGIETFTITFKIGREGKILNAIQVMNEEKLSSDFKYLALDYESAKLMLPVIPQNPEVSEKSMSEIIVEASQKHAH